MEDVRSHPLLDLKWQNVHVRNDWDSVHGARKEDSPKKCRRCQSEDKIKIEKDIFIMGKVNQTSKEG